MITSLDWDLFNCSVVKILFALTKHLCVVLHQVFNSLWYPNFEYDIPLLGVDLISLGKNRFCQLLISSLYIQPLHPTEEYSSKYISHLSNIRAKYPGKHLQNIPSDQYNLNYNKYVIYEVEGSSSSLYFCTSFEMLQLWIEKMMPMMSVDEAVDWCLFNME